MKIVVLAWYDDGGVVKGESVADLFKQLSGVEKKDATVIDVLNVLGRRGWVLVTVDRTTERHEVPGGETAQQLLRYLL